MAKGLQISPQSGSKTVLRLEGMLICQGPAPEGKSNAALCQKGRRVGHRSAPTNGSKAAIRLKEANAKRLH